MSISLKVVERNLKGLRGKQLRRQGKIPAVFYGRGMLNEHFQIELKDLEKILHTDEHILELNVGGKRQELALIQELQRDYLTRKPIHVSFLKVRRGEATWVTVEIVIEGEAPGLTEGGVLIHNLRELEIECTPENVPDKIHVDISALNVGDSLCVRDLKLPPGVKVSDKDLDLEVISIQQHREESVEPTAAPATEVIGEVKAEAAAEAPASKAGSAKEEK